MTSLAVAAQAGAHGALAAPPDVVLVTIDTLRADRVGAYGSRAGATPRIDSLALGGVVVEEAIVAAPQTRPSHATLFTGRHPFEHGVRDNGSPALPVRFPTLASVFKSHGYDTAAFIGAYPVSRASGLDRGFDVFDDPFTAEADSIAAGRGRNERPAREVIDAAISWSSRARTRPSFVWIHVFEPHFPYEPAAPFARRFAESPYDGEVATADAELGRFFDRFPPGAERIVIVTSDHGEGLGDHGEDEHHLFAYDSTLRVPLVVAGGGLVPRRVRGQFRGIDLMPSVLGLAGVAPPVTSGVSRAVVLRSGVGIADNEAYAESLYGSLHFGYAPIRVLRAEGFKFIDTPRPELYRISSDPGERENLHAAREALAAAMRARLRAMHGEDGKRAPAVMPASPEELERLASLGYVGGGAPAATSASSSAPDPKDRVAAYHRYSRAVNAAIAARRAANPPAVVAALEPVAREFPRQYSVVAFLGEALLELGRFEEALPHLTRAREISPRGAAGFGRRAEALAGLGRFDQALADVEAGLRAAPSSSDLNRLRAALLFRLGRGAEGRASLEAAAAAYPKDGLIAAELASVLRNARELPRADALSARAVDLAPGEADAWIARGLVLGALDRTDEANRAFARAREIEPRNADAWFYAFAVAARRGDVGEAERSLARVRELQPARPGLREAESALATLRSPPTVAPRSSPAPPGSVRLRLIRTGDRESAERARARVAAGEDFGAVARDSSIDPTAAAGGLLGTMRASDLAEPLEAAAWALAVGGISAVIPTSRGFVILMREREERP